jgi:hypothetical protein
VVPTNVDILDGVTFAGERLPGARGVGSGVLAEDPNGRHEVILGAMKPEDVAKRPPEVNIL